MSDVTVQREGIRRMLENVYEEGGWCVYLDELRYISEQLKLRNHLELLWQQGRALGVSVVAGSQRPAHVPLVAYSQASHLFLWRTGDDRDLARVAEFGLAPSATIRAEVPSLERHEVLYVDPIRGALARTETTA
jgi:hypothetical protein